MIRNPRHRNWLRVAVYGEAPIPRDLTGPTAPPKGKKKKLWHWTDAPDVNKYDGGSQDTFVRQTKNKKTGESKSKSKSKKEKPGPRQDQKAKAAEKNIQDGDHGDEEDQESGLRGSNPICFRVIWEVGDA